MSKQGTNQQEMDDLAAVNRQRWNALVDADVLYTRPFLDYTPERAREWLDPTGVLGDVTGRDVLCLASGGGQQSVLFALLGANVTVFDLSDNQLERDRAAAAQLGLDVTVVHGDMRDLSAFADDAFDLVYQAYSINFVPSVQPVIAQVVRVLRPGGLYRIQWANPFVQGVDPEQDWTGEGYLMHRAYIDGHELSLDFPTWTVEDANGNTREVASPREFRHRLSTMINTLGAHNLFVFNAWEDTHDEPDPDPGSWDHYKRIAPPYITLWARYLPALAG